MKRKYILLIPLLITIMIYIFGNQKKEITTSKGVFNIYKEVDGEYQKQDTNTFPTTGYYLNTEESSCVNGSTVSQNSDYSVNIAFNKSDKCNLYYDKLKLVTFDANGGSVNTLSKYVKPGDNYGDLPTPERSGYTLLGWNGKNKFNKTNYLLLSDYTIQTGNAYSGATISLKQDTKYMVSAKRYNGYDGITTGYFLIGDTPSINANWFGISHPTSPGNQKKYVSTNDGFLYIGFVYLTQQEMDTVWSNTDVQIEEGEEATEFEPYFVTSSTKVTQNKDHTLKAIWRES